MRTFKPTNSWKKNLINSKLPEISSIAVWLMLENNKSTKSMKLSSMKKINSNKKPVTLRQKKKDTSSRFKHLRLRSTSLWAKKCISPNRNKPHRPDPYKAMNQVQKDKNSNNFNLESDKSNTNSIVNCKTMNNTISHCQTRVRKVKKKLKSWSKN